MGSLGKPSFGGLFSTVSAARGSPGPSHGAHARPLLGSRLRSGSRSHSGPRPAVPAFRGRQRHLVARGPALCRPPPLRPTPPARQGALPRPRGHPRPHLCHCQEVPLPSSRPQGPGGCRLRGRGSLPVPAPSTCWSPLPFSGGPLPGEALGTCADLAPLHPAPPSRPRQGHDSYPSLEAGTRLPRSLVYPRCPPPPVVRALQWQPDTASSIPPPPDPKQSGSIRPRSRDVLGNPARPPAG